MGNVDCPYCDHTFEYHPDEPAGQDERIELQCPDCEMNFTASVHYELMFLRERKAPCLNGEPHKMNRVNVHIEEFPNWRRCEDCGHESRGEYTSKAR